MAIGMNSPNSFGFVLDSFDARCSTKFLYFAAHSRARHLVVSGLSGFGLFRCDNSQTKEICTLGMSVFLLRLMLG